MEAMMSGANNMYIKAAIKLMLSTAILAGASACSGRNANPPVAAAPDGIQAKNLSEPSGQRTVKTGAGLRYSYRMATPVAPNASHSVTIDIAHSYSGGTLSLTATADDGIKLATARANMQLSRGNKISWTIPFTTSGNGLYYINMIGTVSAADGSVQSRAYSVRVEVGDQSASQKPAVKEVILPAQEDISS